MTEQTDWLWCGTAHHFIASRNCRYGMATAVANGRYIVSTVGEYHPAGSDPNEDHEEIGLGRLYETFVFKADPDSAGDCTLPPVSDFGEVDSDGYNDAAAANRGHLAMCRKWDQQ